MPTACWFGKPSYLGFWVAEQPWGQWRQVHEETEWTPGGDVNARAYQPQISPKWIAADGRSFWLAYTDFQVLEDESISWAHSPSHWPKGWGRPGYDFNYQKVEILTE